MKWKDITSAPKDGQEILVCNTKCGSVTQLVWFHQVYKYWVSKGEPDLPFQWTHWTPISNKPTRGA